MRCLPRHGGAHLGRLPAPRLDDGRASDDPTAMPASPTRTAPTARCSARMTLTPTPRSRLPVDGRPRATSPPTAAGCARRAGRRAELLTRARPAHHPAGARATASCVPRDLGRRARPRGTRGSARIQAEHGRDAVAVFGGGGLTNEKAYQLGKFARVALRHAASSTTTAGSACRRPPRRATAPSASTAGCRSRSPTSAAPTPCSCSGANVAETMPPFVQHLAGARGARRADRRRPPPHGDRAAHRRRRRLHLQPLPGTDLALLLGLLHSLVDEGLVDRDYLAARTTGFDDVRASRRAGGGPSGSSASRGVAVDDAARAARLLAAASPVARRPRRLRAHRPRRRAARQGTDTVIAAINLALALGLPGPRGHRLRLPHRARATVRAGASTARRPTSCPATARSTTRPPARMSPRCGASTPSRCPGPGSRAVELLAALGTPGGPRALLVHGSNLVVSRAQRPRRDERLGRLDLLVVCDFVLSETAALADVVLPVTQWAEEEGTMTNLEGRVLRRRQALDAARRASAPSCGSWPSSPRRLGPPPSAPTRARSSTSWPGPRPVGLPTTRASATTGSTRGEALHWPCPQPTTPGTPRLFLDRFATADGRARFVRRRPPRARRRPRDPTPRATWSPAGSCSTTSPARRPAGSPSSSRPRRRRRRAPPAARRRARHRRGRRGARRPARAATLVAPARSPTRSAPTPSSCRSTGPARLGANSLTNDATDPVSGMPEFKVVRRALDGSRASRGGRRMRRRRRGRPRHGRRPLRRGAASPPTPDGRTSPCSARSRRRLQPDPALEVVAGPAPRALGLAAAAPHPRVDGARPASPRRRSTASARLGARRPRRPSCRYDELVLATGSAPPCRRSRASPTTDGASSTGVFVLRTWTTPPASSRPRGNARRPSSSAAGVLGPRGRPRLAGRGRRGARRAPATASWSASSTAEAGAVRGRRPAAARASTTPRRGLDRRRQDRAARRARRRARSATARGHAADLLVVSSRHVPETELARRRRPSRRPWRRRRRRPAQPRDPHVLRDRRLRPAAGRALRGLVAPGGTRRRGSWRGCSTGARTTAPGERHAATSCGSRRRHSMVAHGRVRRRDRDDPRDRVLALNDPSGGRYVEVVVSRRHAGRRDLLGDADVAADLSALDTRLAAVPRRPGAAPARALAGAARHRATRPGRAGRRRRVCRCNGVTSGPHRRACAAAARTVERSRRATRATTGCGGCARSARRGDAIDHRRTQPHRRRTPHRTTNPA